MKPFSLLLSLLIALPAYADNVTVRVLDPQNAPVAGASVEVQVWRERHKSIPAQTTDAGGAVSFEIPAPEGGKPVNGGVSVAAKGFAFNNAALTGKDLEIRLQPGATWRGKVTDDAGKAVAGAVVSVNSAVLGNDYKTQIRLFGEKNVAVYTQKTGADGSFAIPDVPTKMALRWAVEHPDYAIQNGGAALAGAETLVKLAPGGALKGRILDVEGKPIQGAMVYASISRFGGGNDAKSDENGVFTISSLAAGTYSVGAYFATLGEKPDFVLPRLKNVTVEAGKTVDAPDLRAVKGVTIEGTVRDAVSKKPLAGANIYAQTDDDTSASANSDAAGRFTLRVLAGRYKVYVSGPPTGYIRPEEQQSATAGATAPAPLVFDLKKATTLRGTMVDEAGKPLQAQLKLDYDTTIVSDAEGNWQHEPQGSRTLQLAGGDAPDGYLEVVSPLTIDPATEKPITIVLRKLPWQVLPGRALTTEGKPLEGVQIEGTFYTPMGDGNGALNTSQRSAISNANGDFVVPQIRAGIRVGSLNITGKKEGFAFQKGGEVSRNGPIWQSSDLIFAPLNQRIEGVTAPGARVATAGIETLADADGKFKFEGLPATEARVWAFKGEDFGGALPKAPLQIELKAQGAQQRDPDLARDIWNDILVEAQRGTKGQTYYQLAWVAQRLAQAETADFATQLGKATDDRTLLGLSTRFAGKVDFAALETALARIKDADMRLYAFLSAAAKSDDKTLAARALEEAETNFKTPEKEMWWREMNLYRAAAVAAKLGDEAGFAMLDRAVAFTLKNHGAKSTRRNGMPGQTGRDEMFALQAEIVAVGGAAITRRLLSQIEPGMGWDVTALGNAIPVLAQKEGAESVLALLDELDAMPEPANREERHRADQLPQWAFASAVTKVVPLMGNSPQKALDLARRVRDDNYGRAMKWRALAGAAKFQSAENAAKLWREIVGNADAENAPRYAARAFELDPQLGRELFVVALQKVETESKNEWQGRELWGGWAFYAARANAAQARFTLEREWGLARQKKTDGDQLGALAFAMSAIDASRAWQMAREVPADDRFSSLEARRKIGFYLAASEEKRRDFPFSRQNHEEWRALEAE